MRSAIRNFALVFISLVVGMTILEIVLRLFVPLPSPYDFPIRTIAFDERGFWVFEPDRKFTMDNRVDFRGVPVTIGPDGTRLVSCRDAASAASGPRIFILGDSQSFGHGLSDSDSWASRLQCLLRQAGRAVSVHNLGIPGINTDQYFMRLSQIERDLGAGDIVAIVLTWNDLVTGQGWFPDDIETRRCRDGEGDGVRGSWPLCLQQPLQYLNKEETWRLRFYRRTGLLIPSFNSLKNFADSAAIATAIGHVAMPRLKLLWYRLRGGRAFFDKLPAGAFEDNFRIVARMRDRVAARGAGTLVVVLPNRIFSDDFYYAAYSKAGSVFPARDYPFFRAKPLCRQHRLDCFSLFDALKTDRRDRYSFAFDGHLNPAGARAVAEALANRLKPLIPAP